MKYQYKIVKGVVSLVLVAIIISQSGCAFMLASRVGDCQKHKPAKGEPHRKIRPAAFAADFIIGAFVLEVPLIFDFATHAIYKPCVISTGNNAKDTVKGIGNITWGNGFTDTTGAQVSKIFGADTEGFYVTRFENPHPYITEKTGVVYPPIITLQKFNYSGNMLYAKTLSVRDVSSKNYYYPDTVIYLKKKLISIFYEPDASTACALKIGDKGVIDQNKAVIGVTENEKDNVSKGVLARYRYRYAVSNDTTLFLAYYQKKGDKDVSMKLYNADLSEIWDKEINVQALGANASVMKVLLSGDNIYFLLKTTIKKDSDSYSIAEYIHSKNTFATVAGNINGNRPVRDYKFCCDKAGNIVMAGMYEDTYTYGVKGAFLLKIDNGSAKTTVNKSYPFSQDIISLFTNENNKGIGHMTMRDALPLADGSVVMALEQAHPYLGGWVNTTHINYNNTTPSGRPATHTTSAYVESFDYYDGIVLKINADGSLGWLKDIPKYQNMSSASYTVPFVCSYSTFVSGNTVYLLYNDQWKNADYNAGTVAANRKSIREVIIDGGAHYLALVVESIDLTSGEMKRMKFGNIYEDSKLYVYTTFNLPISNKVIVFRSTMFSGKRNESQFGQFILN
jgi:hypothetical protein